MRRPLMRTRILISAGDPSGDFLAAPLIEEIRLRAPGVKIWALGGPELKKTSNVFIEDLASRSTMGWVDPLLHLSYFYKVLKRTEAELVSNKIETVILVDSYGFNIRLAQAAKRQGIKVIYYICPQVWASRKGRVSKLRQFVDKMLCLFPFELDFYRRHEIAASFVGHPMAEFLMNSKYRESNGGHGSSHGPHWRIGLMPGSRRAEIIRHMPILLKSWELLRKRFPDIEGVLYKRQEMENGLYPKRETLASLGIETKLGPDYDSRRGLDLMLTTSGMATLENMLLGLPQVVFYGIKPWWFYSILKRVVHIPHVAMPNVLAGKEIVPEIVWPMMFLTNARTADFIALKAAELLENQKNLDETRRLFIEIGNSLRLNGTKPSAAAAEEVLKILQ